MYHAKTPVFEMQEAIWQLLRLPIAQKTPKKKIKNEDVVIQFRQLIKFFRGNYL
jgi:hypothetical protein